MSIKEKYRGTYFGFINCLWSLIPIFLLLSVYPGVYLEKTIRDQGYSIYISCGVTAFIFCVLSVVSAYLYFRRLLSSDKPDKSAHKSSFQKFCFLEYMLINNVMTILVAGPEIWAYGKTGQIVSVMYAAGFLTSISFVILGVIFDITYSYKKPVPS